MNTLDITMTPDEFIGDKVTYDKAGQMIFANKNGKQQLLVDIRGWGAIQNLFNLDMKAAAEFQDKLGLWIADAINEKLHSAQNEYKRKFPTEEEIKKRQKHKGDYLRELGYPPRVVVKYLDAIKETCEWIYGQIT